MAWTDEDVAAMVGYGSQARRAEEDREWERLRQIHLAAVRRTDYDDDGLARDRERARAIGGDVRGTTPLSTWARHDKGNQQSLAVRPDGDLDVVEDYFGEDPDSIAEDNRRWGEAVTVAKIDNRPRVGDAGLAFPPRRFA